MSTLPPVDPRAERPAGAPGAPATPGVCALRTLLFVCQGPSCSERGGPALLAALREQLATLPRRAELGVCETTCMDHCATGPNVLIGDAGHVQTGVLPEAAAALLELLAGPPRADGG